MIHFWYRLMQAVLGKNGCCCYNHNAKYQLQKVKNNCQTSQTERRKHECSHEDRVQVIWRVREWTALLLSGVQHGSSDHVSTIHHTTSSNTYQTRHKNTSMHANISREYQWTRYRLCSCCVSEFLHQKFLQFTNISGTRRDLFIQLHSIFFNWYNDSIYLLVSRGWHTMAGLYWRCWKN